jgi:hypothetical protein
MKVRLRKGDYATIVKDITNTPMKYVGAIVRMVGRSDTQKCEIGFPILAQIIAPKDGVWLNEFDRTNPINARRCELRKITKKRAKDLILLMTI